MDLSSFIQEALLNKPLQREILKILYSSSNAPFSLPLITSLMPWLKSTFVIDFSFPITSTIAIVEFYPRDHWSFSKVHKNSALLKWQFLWVSKSVYLLEMESCCYSIATTNLIESSDMSKSSIYSWGKKSKPSGKKEWASHAIKDCPTGRSHHFTVLNETSLGVKNPNALSRMTNSGKIWKT